MPLAPEWSEFNSLSERAAYTGGCVDHNEAYLLLQHCGGWHQRRVHSPGPGEQRRRRGAGWCYGCSACQCLPAACIQRHHCCAHRRDITERGSEVACTHFVWFILVIVVEGTLLLFNDADEDEELLLDDVEEAFD